MLFERFEDAGGLAHYSYAVGCPGDGRIAIVDPRRDVDVYLDFARAQGVTISHVLETHVHADFASGARELVARTGAELLVSGYDRGETYEVRFEHRDLADGDSLTLGSVRIAALHTPGHTPEHLSYLVWDLARSEEVPILMLSGDFLFVGSLGRPDLLGEEAKRGLARRLFASVREKLAGLPDGLEIHPAHGAGSMCGAGMSGRPTSTLGFERIANPYLDPRLSEEEFVDRILGSVPPFPPYYRRMKRINSEGPLLLGGLPGLEALPVERFRERLEAGAVVVDLRDPGAFGGGHVPGAFGIGAAGDLSVWASWVVPYDTPILLVTDDPSRVEGAVRALVRVGLDRVEGWLDGGVAAWSAAGLPLAEVRQVTPRELFERLRAGAGTGDGAGDEERPAVLDVRGDDEWLGGHVEGAVHVHAGELAERLEEVPDGGRPVAVICGSGYRSTVAASVLRRHGVERVWNVSGGMRGWRGAGLPVAAG